MGANLSCCRASSGSDTPTDTDSEQSLPPSRPRSVRVAPTDISPVDIKQPYPLPRSVSPTDTEQSSLRPRSVSPTDTKLTDTKQHSPQIPDIRFRVLIIGRANAGKTTVLQRVCDTTKSPTIYRQDSDGKRAQVRWSDNTASLV